MLELGQDGEMGLRAWFNGMRLESPDRPRGYYLMNTLSLQQSILV